MDKILRRFYIFAYENNRKKNKYILYIYLITFKIYDLIKVKNLTSDYFSYLNIQGNGSSLTSKLFFYIKIKKFIELSLIIFPVYFNRNTLI